MELHDTLALSKFVPSIAGMLISIVEGVLNTMDAKSDFEQSFANSAYVLGMCLRTIAKQRPASWVNRVDILSWSRSCVERWAWSEAVLGGLVDLIHAKYVHPHLCQLVPDIP